MGRPKSPCIICLSPYRKDVSSLFRQGMNSALIWNDYRERMKYKSGKKAFYLLLRKHVNQNHNETAIVLPEEQRSMSVASIENFGKKMLEMGMIKIENMEAQDVQLKDVIQAQKLVLDSRKLKLTEDAFSTVLGKLFGPPIPLEGETVNELGA